VPLLPELGRLAEDTVRRAKVPGVAVAVVDGDQVAGAAAAGSADLAEAARMTVAGACNWFSMTKIATATATVMLSEQGSLDLDAPAGRYLGDKWPEAFSDVRVRHLLSHSSGLFNPIPIRWVHRAGDPRPDPAAFLARQLARQKRPRFTPGTRAAYSNIGYLALGEVIAAACGGPYETFVREQLLTPLGMTHTAFSWADPALSGSPRVTAHQRLAPPLTPLLAAWLPRGIVGRHTGRYVALEPFELDGPAYAGLIGPVTDAARLVALHANRGSVEGVRLLRPGSVEAMTDITTSGRPFDLGLGWFPYEVGLGWFRSSHDALGVGQFGGGMGYWHLLRLHPHSGHGAAVMSNTTHHWDITAFADAAIDLTVGAGSHRSPDRPPCR
jgi:CubicO group peptidase (beta-lactamase class C family)